MIIIIGAGLAGLTCALELVQAGENVLVLEASDQVGGRLRTDIHNDGYRLDRGFQVLFTSYPSAKRHLTFEDLKPRKFEPGAILIKNGKRYEITDPIREPERILTSLRNPLISLNDKIRLLRLRQEILGFSTSDIFSGKTQSEGKDESAEQYLQRFGFSNDGFIDNFARPFYGGIFLDRSLSTSARMYQFTFKMLATGDTMLPAEGIQRIPEQLARSLPVGTIRYQARVSELLLNDGKAQGVRLANGEAVEAERVVVATECRQAAKLTGLPLPTEGVSSMCLYFEGDQRLYPQRKILLNSNLDAYVNHAVLLTNIAPTYAPPRKHLLSVTVLNPSESDDELVARRCLAEMARWFLEYDMTAWKFLAAYRIPFSQFSQKPGVFDHLPTNTTPIEGLYLAGEYTQSSSIQGAMHSGEYAAKAILHAPILV